MQCLILLPQYIPATWQRTKPLHLHKPVAVAPFALSFSVFLSARSTICILYTPAAKPQQQRHSHFYKLPHFQDGTPWSISSCLHTISPPGRPGPVQLSSNYLFYLCIFMLLPESLLHLATTGKACMFASTQIIFFWHQLWTQGTQKHLEMAFSTGFWVWPNFEAKKNRLHCFCTPPESEPISTPLLCQIQNWATFQIFSWIW